MNFTWNNPKFHVKNHANQGDGYCDDDNNVENCNYDNGDCCGGVLDPNYCQQCICYNSSSNSTQSPTNGNSTTGMTLKIVP